MGNSASSDNIKQINTNSNSNKNNNIILDDSIFDKILEISNQLILTYKKDFLNPDFCNQIAYIYQNKLEDLDVKVIKEMNQKINSKNNNKEIRLLLKYNPSDDDLFFANSFKEKLQEYFWQQSIEYKKDYFDKNDIDIDFNNISSYMKFKPKYINPKHVNKLLNFHNNNTISGGAKNKKFKIDNYSKSLNNQFNKLKSKNSNIPKSNKQSNSSNNKINNKNSNNEINNKNSNNEINNKNSNNEINNKNSNNEINNKNSNNEINNKNSNNEINNKNSNIPHNNKSNKTNTKNSNDTQNKSIISNTTHKPNNNSNTLHKNNNKNLNNTHNNTSNISKKINIKKHNNTSSQINKNNLVNNKLNSYSNKNKITKINNKTNKIINKVLNNNNKNKNKSLKYFIPRSYESPNDFCSTKEKCSLNKKQICQAITENFIVKSNIIAAILTTIPQKIKSDDGSIKYEGGICYQKFLNLNRCYVCVPYNYKEIKEQMMTQDKISKDILKSILEKSDFLFESSCRDNGGYFLKLTEKERLIFANKYSYNQEQKKMNPSSKYNTFYIESLKKLKRNYFESLNYLITILDTLKNNLYIDNESLNKISKKTKEIIDNMYNLCNYYYIFAVIALINGDLSEDKHTVSDKLEKAFEKALE